MRIASVLAGLLSHFHRPASGRTIFALIASLFMAAGGAIAYQVNTSSSGTGPVVKTYPSGFTATYSVGGANAAFNGTSVALNSVGGVTSTLLSPQIAATTNAMRIDVNAIGCTVSTFRCSNRGTLTINFSQPVTNPVLHISGLGGNVGATIAMFHTSLNLTSWTATGTPTLSAASTGTNFLVTSNEIRVASVNGGTSCTAATAGGCGSVRVNGTVSSLTFRLDLLMGGTTDPAAATTTRPLPDAFNITTTVDEDFGDAPSAYQASPVASHVIGNLFMGSSVSADNTTTVNGNPQATSPVANGTASGDTSGDDGVTFPTLIRGQASQIDVAVTGSGGRLQGWIDWGADNSFATAGDRIATDVTDGGAGDADGSANGVIRLNVTPPTGTTQVTANARFRWSTTSGLGINGVAPDGEVEDYQVIVYPQRNDLSLTKTVSNASPSSGSALSYTLTVDSAALSASASNTTASGITVQDTLPAGFTFTSASGTGTYNSGTGVWSVGSVAPGASASITINGTVTAAAGTVTNVAQITASSLPDPDSTVNNGVTTEDDYATVSFSVPSVLPAPVCTVGPTSQIIQNGNFSSGTGPSWTNWTAGSVWFGTGSASANNDATGGDLIQTGLSGLNFGPGSGSGSVLQLTAWWRNGGPPAGSTTALLRVLVAGTEYARITSDPSAGTSASVTYSNGASGNLSTITEFTSTGWRINLPTSVASTGSVQFTFTPGGGTSDDYEIDNVALYTCTKALLTLVKSSTPWDDGVNKVFNLPGNDVTYSLTAANTTNGQPDNNAVFLYDALPSQLTFFNGDANGAAAGTNPVIFTDSGSGLTFNYATDVAYSNGTSAPTSMADCTYTPAAGYDASVKYVCFNPKGTMAAKTGAPTPSFTLSFRTRIN